MAGRYSRRQFIATAGKAGALLAIGGSVGTEILSERSKTPVEPKEGTAAALAVASGSHPSAMVAAAVGALGGMSAFVRKGGKVVIKPNAAWAREPQYAATTNPGVLGAVVALCREAGASQITVVEHVVDQPAERVFRITGIRQTCESAGARVISADNASMYRRLSISARGLLKEEYVIGDILDADVFINVPIAKCHPETGVSLGMNNLMGAIWSRQPWHSSPSIHRCIAEFSTALKPHLTILDANRILVTDGPKGPGETRDVGQVVAGIDPVAVDAYGATLFDIQPEAVEHIRLANELGAGEMDLTRVRILKV